MVSTISPRMTAGFVMVPCRCGRLLRARRDQCGTEIICWDCRASHLVAFPRARARFLGELGRSVAALLDRAYLGPLAAAAVLFALALAVPQVGVGLALAVLTVGAYLYGEMVAAPEPLVVDDADDEPATATSLELEGAEPASLPRRAWALAARSPRRWALGLLFALGLVGPLWLIGSATRHAPQIGGWSLALLLTACAAFPLATAATLPGEPGDRPGPGRLAFVRRHPLLTLATLAIVPLALILAEGLLAGLVYESGSMPLFLLDHMPIPGRPIMSGNHLYYGYKPYCDMPPEVFNSGYPIRLRQGFSFLGAIPTGLSLDTRARLDPNPGGLDPAEYLRLRLTLTALVGLILGASLMVQARCLRVLARSGRTKAA